MSTILNPIVLPATLSGTSATIAAQLDNWFTWSPAEHDLENSGLLNRNFYFSTRKPPTNFPNNIHIYTVTGNNPPQTLADLTEVAYIHQGDFHLGYGYENGASAAFTIPFQGTTQTNLFYIEVISRDGISTGNLSLFWDPWVPLRLGACGECNSTQTGLCKVADINLNSLSFPADGAHLIPIGDFASGAYMVKYCQPANVVVLANFAPGQEAQFTIGGDPQDLNPSGGFVRFTTPIAECAFGVFCHDGGPLSMEAFLGLNNPLNIFNGGPTFGLYNINPSQMCTIAQAGLSFVHPEETTLAPGQMIDYSMIVTVKNNSFFFNTGAFTVGLQANGTLIQNPSAPVALSLDNDSSTTFTVNFSSNAMDILFGTFEFLDCAGNPVGAQTILLAEALLACGINAESSCGFSTPGAPSQCQVPIINVGRLPASTVNVTVTPVTPGGLVFSNQIPGQSPCIGPYPFPNPTWQANYALTPGTFNVQFATQRADLTQSQHQQATVQVTVGNPPNAVISMPAAVIFVNLN